jgi:hypothetical protein
MKQLFILSLLIQLVPRPAAAQQLGDFALDSPRQSTQHRKYVTIPANPDLKGGPLKNIFIGKNYRPEWQQPVRVPVLNFQTDMGGLKPEEEGGGRQTRSLEVKDAAGNKWVLRSVKKYPDNVVNPMLEGTIAEKIVNDGISASYPYSVLSVGTLARAAGVPYMPNTLVYIPDDPALGEFRNKYKNSLSLLELRTVDTTNREDKTYNTEDIIPKLFASARYGVDQRIVLKGRLLDNFIMDFDRHEGQWEWVKKDSGGRTWYYPVAKDRDQAFFDINGLIPRVVRLLQPTMGSLQGLRANTAKIKNFNFVAKDFDRSFLHQLDEAAWNREIDQFLASVTDTVIADAIHRQPHEILRFHGDDIIETLQEKREHFKENMLRYYRFVSRKVAIPGTNERELFTINTDNDGVTYVEIKAIDSSGQPGQVIFQRSFTPDVTKEIRLHGLEGDDQFVVRGASHAMTIRLIGGPGKDVFTNEGEGKAHVYDASFEENVVGKGFKNKLSDDPMVNEYSRLGYPYTIVLPFIGVELTKEGGLFLGPTLRIARGGFRKDPYASMHFLYATRAINTSSYHLKYNADFIGIAKKTDLVLRSEAFLPTVRTYFFGLGNNTTYNEILNRMYYLVSYKRVDASLQARYSPTKWLQFTAGPLLQYLQLEDRRNDERFVHTVYPEPARDKVLFDGHWWGGAEVSMQINTRNHPLLTTRGIHTNLYARGLRSMERNTYDVNQLGGNISFFTDFLWKKVIVLATSFGADHNEGKFIFPQAQYLGWRSNLRGYNVQRFAGRSRAYNNSELRINLGQRNFYFFKGYAGLIGFHDIGRVWTDGETSDTWHKGYGGGIWVAPFNQVVVLGTVASSKEEKSWIQVSFGFQF